MKYDGGRLGCVDCLGSCVIGPAPGDCPVLVTGATGVERTALNQSSKSILTPGFWAGLLWQMWFTQLKMGCAYTLGVGVYIRKGCES